LWQCQLSLSKETASGPWLHPKIMDAHAGTLTWLFPGRFTDELACSLKKQMDAT
jgi:hypothetical protein